MARNKAFDESDVLHKAMDVFWEKGYCATSMEDLVDRMGINRASMYNTFGDKHQLFLEALNHYRRQQAHDMIALLEQSPSVKAAIQTLLHNVAQNNDCNNPKGCFIVNAAVEFFPKKDNKDEREAVLKIIRDNLATVETALSAAIAKGQASGEIKATQSPEALAKFVLTTINGMRVAERAGYEAPHYQAIIQVIESVLFK
ncbi:MAG: TetR/AcrR family transcriptional regulator [Saprospiraceae bacterium]